MNTSVPYIYLYLQPCHNRLNHLELSECTLTVGELVDLVRLVLLPDGLPCVKINSCKLQHESEVPHDGHDVSVGELVISRNTELNLTVLEDVIQRINIVKLALYVIYYNIYNKRSK